MAGAPRQIAAMTITIVMVVATRGVLAQPPSYGLDFAHVGAAGNRATIPSEVPRNPTWEVGSVAHEYRITRTEITVSQWFEFVDAYWPYHDGFRADSRFTSSWIAPRNLNPELPPDYRISAGAEHFAANVSWRMAARYANWLHNGKALTREAFENGVYDTTTFTENPNGTLNDQSRHSPGSKFWIATEDEWVKAMYYDPNRHGPGQEGYWTMPDGGDDVLISALPHNGGETNAGLPGSLGSGPWLNVDAYSQVMSPWGLLGGSGNLNEWMEDWEYAAEPRSRTVRGSTAFSSGWHLRDRVDFSTGGTPSLATHGFRIVSIVPSPSGIALILVGGVLIARRRR